MEPKQILQEAGFDECQAEAILEACIESVKTMKIEVPPILIIGAIFALVALVAWSVFLAFKA